MDYSLKEAAAVLGIAPSTLHLWSEHFGALLSDSARQASARGGSTTFGRYTESDIAILQRAKTLIWSGHTYDRVRRELLSDQHADQADTSSPMRRLTPPDAHVYASVAPPMADEHAIVEDHETTTTPASLDQAPRSPIDQFRDYLRQTHAADEHAIVEGNETTTTPASLDQAPRSPIDQFRDYLRHAQVDDEPVHERKGPGQTHVQHWRRAVLASLMSLDRRWRQSGSVVQPDQQENQRSHVAPREPVKGGSFDPGTPHAGPGSTTMTPEVASSEIAPIVERIGTGSSADLRALKEELNQHIQGAERETELLEDPISRTTGQPGARSARAASPSSGFPSAATPLSPPAEDLAPRPAQGQESQLDQLREYMRQLQAENEALREQRALWKERIPWLVSYRTAMIIALCCSAILIALGIMHLSNPRALVNDSGAKVALSASPVSAANSTANVPLNATPHPQLTPRTALAQAPANPSIRQASSVAASPQPLPTAVPSPTRAPTAIAVVPVTDSTPASDILLQLAEIEAALRTGHLEATITYGSGQRSTAQVRFDLGDEQRVPRFEITTTYEGSTGTQTFARTTIGDQSWERQQDGRWAVMPARESALKQLQVFLPRSDSISDFTRVTVKGAAGGGAYSLRWYDAARDADVTLLVDAAGIPQQLRRDSRVNSLVLTVTYSGWNTAEEIIAPD